MLRTLAVVLTRRSRLSSSYKVSPRVSLRTLSHTSNFCIRETSKEVIEATENRLKAKESQLFDILDSAGSSKNKDTFLEAIEIYKEKNKLYRKGHVEFIEVALDRLVEYGVERDLEVYKALMAVFPEDSMIPKSIWEGEMLHYPKQQHCGLDILDKANLWRVVPDDELGDQIVAVFGNQSIVFRKYQRMMYWLPKLRWASPYYLPELLPEDPRCLATLALKQINIDLQTVISECETSELGIPSAEQTWIVSAQSLGQRDLLNSHDPATPVFVEGGYRIWLRHKCLTYFQLRADLKPDRSALSSGDQREKTTPKTSKADERDGDDFEDYNFSFLNEERTKAVGAAKSIHEQPEGIILATCVTGTGTKDSLNSWVTMLQKDCPSLKVTPVVFALLSPETALEVKVESVKSAPASLWIQSKTNQTPP